MDRLVKLRSSLMERIEKATRAKALDELKMMEVMKLGTEKKAQPKITMSLVTWQAAKMRFEKKTYVFFTYAGTADDSPNDRRALSRW